MERFPQLVLCDWFNCVQITVQMGYTPGLASVTVVAKQLALNHAESFGNVFVSQ